MARRRQTRHDESLSDWLWHWANVTWVLGFWLVFIPVLWLVVCWYFKPVGWAWACVLLTAFMGAIIKTMLGIRRVDGGVPPPKVRFFTALLAVVVPLIFLIWGVAARPSGNDEDEDVKKRAAPKPQPVNLHPLREQVVASLSRNWPVIDKKITQTVVGTHYTSTEMNLLGFTQANPGTLYVRFPKSEHASLHRQHVMLKVAEHDTWRSFGATMALPLWETATNVIINREGTRSDAYQYELWVEEPKSSTQVRIATRHVNDAGDQAWVGENDTTVSTPWGTLPPAMPGMWWELQICAHGKEPPHPLPVISVGNATFRWAEGTWQEPHFDQAVPRICRITASHAPAGGRVSIHTYGKVPLLVTAVLRRR